MLIALFIAAIISGCSTQPKQNYATGYAANPYTPPPQTGIQDGYPAGYPPPQPLAQGYGCGV